MKYLNTFLFIHEFHSLVYDGVYKSIGWDLVST